MVHWKSAESRKARAAEGTAGWNASTLSALVRGGSGKEIFDYL
jgi:hypothetical protein